MSKNTNAAISNVTLCFFLLIAALLSYLRNIRLYELSLSDLIAGASAQGEFEERLKKVIKDVVETPNTVLFIDEIHMLIGAG